MKRIIISFVLGTAALALAIFSYFDVKSTGDRLVSSLEQCVGYIQNEDISSAERELYESINLWEESHTRLELYLNSEELFEIDRNFAKSKKLLDTEDVGELENLLNESIDEIERLIENQSPKLSKVF